MKASIAVLAGALSLASCAPALGQGGTTIRPEPARHGPVAAADIGFSIHVAVTPTAAGLVAADYPVVETVRKGSPAESAGVAAGDVILSVDGRDAREPRLFRDLAPGRKYALHVRRGTSEMDFVVEATARTRPASATAS